MRTTTALLCTTLLLAASGALAREPLAAPGWKYGAPETTPLPPPQEPTDVSAPALRPERQPGQRRVAITLGAGAVLASPSVELEVAPFDHVSFYAGAEASLTQLGGGAQAGARVRPLEGLVGPFLDLHLRWSSYEGLLLSGVAVEETFNPGVMAGLSHVAKNGFMVSAGLGVNFLAKQTQTKTSVTLKDTPVFPIPVFDTQTSTRVVPQPELRLQFGWAL